MVRLATEAGGQREFRWRRRCTGLVIIQTNVIDAPDPDVETEGSILIVCHLGFCGPREVLALGRRGSRVPERVLVRIC